MAVQATLGSCRLAANTIIGPAIRKVLDVGQQGWTCERTNKPNTWLAVPEGALGSAMSRPVSVSAAVAPARRRPPGGRGSSSLDGPMFGEVDRVSLRQFYGTVAQNSA